MVCRMKAVNNPPPEAAYMTAWWQLGDSLPEAGALPGDRVAHGRPARHHAALPGHPRHLRHLQINEIEVYSI